mmetsp:Transcript_28239/g.67989  ORF Transcript_28239/g.67989 Transcript_28239/m.67989 type:complete len:89 (+) Transcript_28239:455-721(+)
MRFVRNCGAYFQGRGFLAKCLAIFVTLDSPSSDAYIPGLAQRMEYLLLPTRVRVHSSGPILTDSAIQSSSANIRYIIALLFFLSRLAN